MDKLKHKVDYTCLSSFPTEGIPSDLQKVHCTKIGDDGIDPDRGPLDSDEIPFNHQTELRDYGSTLLKYFYFVSICKYLLTAGLREQAFNVTQLWPGILKFSRILFLSSK